MPERGHREGEEYRDVHRAPMVDEPHRGQIIAQPLFDLGGRESLSDECAPSFTDVLAGPGERLELTHRATDRAIFARGAVRAAQWAVGRAPGRYAMEDVMGLR